MAGAGGHSVLRGPAVLLAVLALAGTAAGANPVSAPPDGPDLATMTLSPADYAVGGLVLHGEWHMDGSMPTYFAVNGPGRFGSTQVQAALSFLVLQADGASAAADFTQLRVAVSTPKRRAAFVKTFVVGGSKTKTKLTVTAGAPLDLHLGDEAFQIRLAYRLGTTRYFAVMDMVRVDRVEGIAAVVGKNGTQLPSSVALGVANALAARMKTGLIVTSAAPPVVSGTAQQGQTLTADRGRWQGGPYTFTYQWSRCDAAGANCTAIAGATGDSYTPTAADAGSTLEMTVLGANGVSSQSATSTPTATVA